MKTSFLLLAFFLLAVISTFAQDRPRYYDNFDTNAGVQAQHPQAPSGPKRSPGDRLVRKQYIPSPQTRAVAVSTIPTAQIKYVKKTALVTMSVYDGFAQPEAPRYVAKIQMNMAVGSQLRGFTTGDHLVDSYIVDSSRRYRIDPLLIFAQMSQESSFKLRATSNKGASGLMQLMPATARRLGVTNIYDPQQNIEGGVKYMRILLDLFSGDVNLALAGYNAGEAAVMKYGYQIPPYAETQNYVQRISTRYRTISANATVARNFSR